MEHIKPTAKTIMITEADKWSCALDKIVSDDREYTLVVQENISYVFLQRAFNKQKNVQVVQADPYSKEFIKGKFDTILSCPYFSGRSLNNNSGFISRKSHEIALENLSDFLNIKGQLLICLPVGIGYTSGVTAKVRKFVQDKYAIREISALPADIFDFTKIMTYFMVIENDANLLNEYTNLYFYAPLPNKRKKENTIQDIKIEYEQKVNLKDYPNWHISTMKIDDDLTAFRNSGIPKQNLSNVAEIFSGKFVGKKNDNGNITVLGISNLGALGIDYSNAEHTDLPMRKASAYILQEGDILLTARSTTLKSAIFHEQSFPCIANVSLIVIRPNKKTLNSIYLKLFLDSVVGNKLIKSVQQGAVLISINYKDLGLIDVPVPDITEQNIKAAKYQEECDIYEGTIIEAKKRWDNILAELTTF